MDTTQNPEQAGVAEVDLGDTALTDLEVAFSDDQVRLFGVKGMVLPLPADMGFNLDVENPVQVVDSEGKIIGTARVLPEEGVGLVAEGLLQYNCPERLDLEEGLRFFFHASMSVNYLYGTDEESNPATIAITAASMPDATPETVKAALQEKRPRAKLVPFMLLRVGKLMLSSEPRRDAQVTPVRMAVEEEQP